MTFLKEKKTFSIQNLTMHYPVGLDEAFERMFDQICHILVLCRPRDRIFSPNFYEKCSIALAQILDTIMNRNRQVYF